MPQVPGGIPVASSRKRDGDAGLAGAASKRASRDDSAGVQPPTAGSVSYILPTVLSQAPPPRVLGVPSVEPKYVVSVRGGAAAAAGLGTAFEANNSSRGGTFTHPSLDDILAIQRGSR